MALSKDESSMGRPQAPLERDGSPVREFAFWLRDLRNRSGLTYEQLAKISNYATSTVQEATAGRRLPTLNVVKAFVKACHGDQPAWREYWTQIRRSLDPDAPPDLAGLIVPSWAASTGFGRPATPSRRPAQDNEPSGPGQSAMDDADRWYVESFTALLRLDADPIEAVEQREIVATVDDLSELSTSISVPRHPDDAGLTHQLEIELLHGGSLELREQPYESFFRNVIVLPRPLQSGDRHQYAVRQRIPPGQPMAAHYVHVPFHRTDHFELRVRFDPMHPPQAIWKLSGTPTAVIYERGPASQTMTPDRFGEVHVEFRDLRAGLGYGLCWLDEKAAP
jgi:transcriptional regulator with XRE-family HTH domain